MENKQLVKDLKQLNTAVMFRINSLEPTPGAQSVPVTKCLDEINTLLTAMQNKTTEAYFSCTLEKGE